MEPLFERLDAELRALATPERAVNEKAYLKSTLIHLGTTVPQSRSVAKRFHVELAKTDRWPLVEQLWSSGVYEHRWVGTELLRLNIKNMRAADVPRLEALLRQAKTWALVDVIAPEIMGPLFVRDPSLGATLDRWSTDPDFWVRRAALLALLVPLRKGGGDWDRFTRYADGMLEEKEFFIRKAIGWILRETAKKRPLLVMDWMLPRASRFSGLTFREGSRGLAVAYRAQLEQARAT